MIVIIIIVIIIIILIKIIIIIIIKIIIIIIIIIKIKTMYPTKTGSYPVNSLRIISSIMVTLSCVMDSLLLSDSTRGPSVLFFFSAFNCL